MPRTITVPREGSAPAMRVETVFGVFKEIGANARLVSVDGLQSVVKLSGSGNTGSIGITVADMTGSIKLLMDSTDIHKTKATIYQDITTTAGATTSIVLFRGEISSPVVWNPSSGTVKFDIVSIIETEEIGFSVQQSDFDEGEIIPGLKYPNGSNLTIVPSSLEGKAWPLVFGSCIHVPAVGFTLEEDPNSEDPDEADKLPTATVASEEWFPIEPSFVAQYIAACRGAMGFFVGQKFDIFFIIDDEVKKRTDSKRTIPAQGVESKAKAWSGLVQLNKRIRRAHPNKVEDFENLARHIFIDENALKEEWDNGDPLDDPQASFSEFQYYREERLHAQLTVLVDILLQPDWPAIALDPDHGLNRGQSTNINLLPGDFPESQFYRIKNAKVQGSISNNVLNVQDIIATYRNIRIIGGSTDPTMFKVNVQNSDELSECEDQITARGVDLNGMFLKVLVKVDGFNKSIKQLIKVDRHVKLPQKDGVGAILKDDNGNILYEPISEVYYTPIFLILDSELTDDNFDDELDRQTYRVSANVVISGTIEEAAPFVLPSWGLDTSYRTSERVRPVMVPDNWTVNEKLQLLVADSPRFDLGDETPLKTVFKMGSSGFTISNGDTITEYFDSRTGNNSCDEDDDDSAQSWTWICNQMHNTIIKQVYAYRTYNNRKIFTVVPSRYFFVNDSRIIAGQECTVLEVPRKLSEYEDEGWEDQLYVTMTSPVGPNTALICKWMIEEYSDFLVDSTTFDQTEASLANYPSNFAILNRRSLLSTLEDIAWQARCSIYVSDTTIFMRYLSKKHPSTSTIDVTNIIEGTLTVELSITEKLVTKLTGLWKPSYQDLDLNYELRPLRRVYIRTNIDKYGLMEEEREFWIYNIRSLVVKSLKFWAIRWGNTWKRARFDSTLEALDTETQDTFTLDLSGIVSTEPVDVIAESITYDSENLKLKFDTWTPVRSGEMTPYDLAYLA